MITLCEGSRFINLLYPSLYKILNNPYSFITNMPNKSDMKITAPPKKKLKQNEISQETYAINDFSNFKLEKILSNNTKSKTCFLQGTFEDNAEQAIVILEKKPFSESSLTNEANGYLTNNCSLKKSFINDIYGNYECYPKTDINGMKAVIIYPATEQHIKKFEDQEIYLIQETPDIYEKLVLPHIVKEQLSLQWVYNILDNGKEKERILVQDDCPKTGFVTIPDLKWDGKDVSSMYYLAIVRQKDIKSIRDLNATHLPMLKNVRDKVSKTIEEKHGYVKEQLRIFFHYHPSFYHLHMHFVYLKFEAPGIFCERAHLLDTVINNLKLMSDYYEKATLPIVTLERETLYTVLRENGLLENIKKS